MRTGLAKAETEARIYQIITSFQNQPCELHDITYIATLYTIFWSYRYFDMTDCFFEYHLLSKYLETVMLPQSMLLRDVPARSLA
jgi:hypothetical protein